MPKSKTYFLGSEPGGLDLEFYQGYDESLLYNKAVTLWYAINGGERLKDEIQELVDQQGGGRLSDKYFEGLRAELHFTALHQFEGFFSLLIAICQELPHWLYLTTYPPGEIQEKAKLFVDGKIGELTGGIVGNAREFLAQAIYLGSRPQDETLSARWDENLDNVAWLIRRIARKYDEDLPVYNSYKHGLRLLTGPSRFAVALNGPDGTPGQAHTLAASEDSLAFLELDKRPDGTRVRHTTRHFSPQESFYYVCKMSQMLETIKATRLAALRGETEGPSLNLFLKIEKDEIMKMGAQSAFRFSRTI